jgi:hypothetical protein
MNEKMNFIKGFFFSDSPLTAEEKKKKRVKDEEEERISLCGRDTPIDLVEKASFRVAHINDAQYTVNPDRRYLTVNLPKQHRRNKRKDYVMPLCGTMEELMSDIKEEMEYDGFASMDSIRLAAEYPNFFWNGMFLTLGSVSVLDAELEKKQLLQKKRRKK